MAFAILDSQTSSFTCAIDATEAHQDEEEYKLSYLPVRHGEAGEGWSKTFTITKGEIQELIFELNDDGTVNNVAERARAEYNTSLFIFAGAVVSLMVVVLIIMVWKRRKV